MINIKILASILERFKLTDEQSEELQKVIYSLEDGRLQSKDTACTSAVNNKPFRISYLDCTTNELGHKAGFGSASEAMKWVKENEATNNILALKLLVDNDYIGACSTVYTFNEVKRC